MTKIVVVGAGLIGRKHIEVVRQEAILDGIIDPSDAAKIYAADLEVPWFPSIENYLDVSRADGAIIATPNQLHLQNATAFIEAGVPILVEKPLADNAGNAAEIVELETLRNVPVLVGHHRRHSPLVKAAKAAIASGRLGRIVSVHAQFWLLKPDDYFDLNWRKQLGAGPTYINLIHDIDLLRYFCGEIVSVQAKESQAIREFEVEDTSAVILEFQNGALGTVSISDTIAAPWSWELTAGENPVYPKTNMACYMVGGTKGSLSIPDMRLWAHPGKQSWWEPIKSKKLSFQPADPIKEQLLHFIDVISNGVAPLVSGLEGLINLSVLDAIKKAARFSNNASVEINQPNLNLGRK